MSILLAVCKRHNVTLEEMRGAGRARHIGQARKEAIRLLVQAGLSHKAIAKTLRKNTSTIGYWVYDRYRDYRRGYYRQYHNRAKVSVSGNPIDFL